MKIHALLTTVVVFAGIAGPSFAFENLTKIDSRASPATVDRGTHVSRS